MTNTDEILNEITEELYFEDWMKKCLSEKWMMDETKKFFQVIDDEQFICFQTNKFK